MMICALVLAVNVLCDAPLDTRITALLPESEGTERLAHADARLGETFEQRFMLLVAAQNDLGAAEPDNQQLVNQLQQQLADSGVIDSFDSQTPPRPDQLLASYRYRLLTDELQQADAEQWRQRGLSRLFTPGIGASLATDPFGLLDAWLGERISGPVTWHQGGLSIDTSGGRWGLVSATLAGNPYDTSVQRALTDSVARFSDTHPEVQLLRAGLVFHAAAGAEQAKREITTIGLGSLLGIIALLALVFRRPVVLATLLLPVATGLVFATALTWLLFGSLNLITLAFGASLIGISVDYALHLQCTRQLHPERPLSRLWPGLTLGLISSLCAYLVQLATPMPGLRQMATFAALGLIGAWLSVRLWLPLLPVHPHPATGAIAMRLNHLRLKRPHPSLYLAAGLILMAAIGVTISQGSTRHDPRQLNPSPASLVEQQQRVQALLEQPASFRYLLVSADSSDRLLERLEALDAQLGKLENDGHLSFYQHLAQAVPSAKTQQANLDRVRQAYAEALPRLLESAKLPVELMPKLMTKLDAVPTLTPETWLTSRAGESDRALWLQNVDTPGALVMIGDIDATAAEALNALAQAPGVIYRDRVQSLSDQLAGLSSEILQWLGLALALLALTFGWRYRRRAWRVLLPPVGAVIITLGIFAASHTGLTLFHLLGLLLVLGIGLDAGIFSTEHPADPAAWLAISLSCASSLLAFGLLAFSATPALHFLGTTCLIGLVATWCLVPLSRGVDPNHRSHCGPVNSTRRPLQHEKE
ncbi:MAG: MMPL family transporter [Halomonas sp.]|uniref:MMPL family transporter n=1 Tax=Halomonas sp. TaxID=1486246 RepID=UPI003F8E2CD8